MKKLAFLLLLSSLSLLGQEDPKWMRYSAISPDGSQIAFTYKGDLYKVSSSGGDAVQLTFHSAHDYMPVWNKKGDQLAFASNRYGNFDVYIMSANGGKATRLTFHSNDESPYTFTNNGKEILFGAIRQDDVSNRQHPHRSQSELYSVPTKGGRISQVFTFPAEHVQFSKDGNTMLYQDRPGGENIWRKHHTSSVTRDIWVYNKKTDTHEMITSFKGEDRNPVFTADEKSFYYLSEQNGTFNVYKKGINSNSTEQLTQFKTHPVRFLSMGNGLLAFGYDGELYTMREGERPKKLKVRIRTQDKNNSDRFISINGGIREMSVSPNGKEIAFIARGEVFVTSVDKSFTKRLTNTPENERFVTWTPDGKSVVYSSERDGRWSIFKTEKVRKEEPFFYASTLIKESPVISSKVDNYIPQYSPDGKYIAFIEGRRSLVVKEVKSNKKVTLLTPKELYHMRDGDKYFTWSPDSKWLLVDWGKTLSNSEVMLMAADGSKKMNLNQSGYSDYYPKWVNGGKQMIWFSNRNGLKSYATSGRSQSDVYSMYFTQDAWDEANLSDEDYKLMMAIKEEEKKNKKKDAPKKDDKKKGDKKDEKKDAVKALEFDWDNMRDRTKRLTIHSSRLGDAVLSKKGDILYYLSSFEGRANLWSTNLRTRETKMIMKLNGGGSLEWDKEQKNLYLLSNGRISKLNPAAKKRKGVSIKGEMEFDKAAERQAMFDHVWIRTKNIFYEPTFHGIDWNKMKKEYSKYVPHIGNDIEFSEMLSELLGELNVSHAGSGFRGSPISNADATASLGIFMNYDHKADGILIDEIIKGGPLDKAKFNIKAGMIIEKIDGEVVSKDVDVAKYLNRKAGKFVLLDIYDPSAKKKMNQSITVKPISLGAENGLLYRRWVKANEKEVKEKSNGLLGYVHIPGMGDGPYRSIYQDMMGKYFESKGVIVDTRFNGGGDLVADLAMFFTGVPFITYATADKVVGGEPTSRWTKPTLTMFNESNYSDGHCYAQGYTDLKIGKTVGMPVPGTCSFAGWEGLPNGAYWGVVPVSAKNKSGEWMENNQTEPMIKVKNMPGVLDKGRDQQLERAIQELLKDVR